MQIIDNLMDEEYLSYLHEMTLGAEFPWYFNEATTGIHGDRDFMFTHMALRESGEEGRLFPTLQPMIEKIRLIQPFRGVRRIKVNMYTNQGHAIHHTEHLDDEAVSSAQMMVGVFSVNTCNGGTVVDGEAVTAQANRLVLFDNVKHHGFLQTDTAVRVCINFNFIR